MAELAFRVRADYEELLQLNNELQRNRAEMLACNTATDEGRQKMAALEKEYGRISDSIKTIVEKAAQVAIDMKSTSETIEDSYVSLMANVKKANEVIGSSFKETNKQFDDARKGIEGTKDAISKSIDILTAKIAVLSRQRTLYDAKGDNKRVEQINEEITATEALIQRQKESMASIGERGNTLSERAESIRNIIVFYDQLMEKISSAKDLSDEQIKAYNEQIETMRGVILSEFENLKKEVSPVTDMLADAQKELSSLRSNPDIIRDFEDIRQKLSAIRLELSSADPDNTQHIEELENEYDNLAQKLGEVITVAKEYEKSNVISVDLSDYISQVGNAELATKEFLKSVGYQADFLHSALAVTKNDITSQVENIKKEISDLEVIKASHESNGETAQALLTQQDIDRRKEYIQLMENSLSLIDKENAKTIELAQSKELAETGTSVHNKVGIEEVSRVRREMSSLREEMLNVDSSTDEGKQKVAELNARYADLSKTLSSLIAKEKEVSIGSTLSETGEGVHSLANAVSDGDAKMSEMLTTISEKHTKAVEEIAKAKEDITRVIDNLNTEIFSLEAEKKTVKTTSEKESIDAEIESIRARIAENERLREAINSVETAQEERIQVVERSMDIFDAFADKQLSAEHATEATVAESQDGINRMLENTRAKIDSFNEAVEKIPGITDSIKSQEDSFKIRMEIKDNFTEARERLQSLRVEMFSVDTSTEEGKKKLADLQAQYADWLTKFKDTLSQAVAQQDAGVIDVPFAARIKDAGDVELALNQIFELAKGESSAIVSVFEGAKEQLNEMADSVSAEINELYGKQRELRQQGKYSEADAMDTDITQKVDERNSIFDSQKRIDDELSRYRAVAGEIEEIKGKISTKTEIDIDFDDFNEARAYISDIRKEMNELDLSTEEGKKRFSELNHELLAASDYLRQTAGGAALTMSQGDSEYGLGDSMVRFMNESAKVNGEIGTMLKDIRENYQETVDSISASIDTIDSKLEELDANLVRLQRERAVSESAGDTKAVERYDTEIAQLETQISNQQKLRSILEEKAAAAKADYNAFMTSVGMLDEFAADQKEAVQTTETTISSSTSELEKMIETARKHYTNLNQDIKDSREVVSEIGQVNGISLGNTSVLKDFTEAKGKLADLRDQMMAVDTTTSVGQAQLRALTKEYDSWLIRLRQAIDLSKQYAQSGAEREDITRFIEQAGVAEEAVNKIYSAAKNESDALAKSIADAKAKVEKQISDLNAELDSLKKERNINISSGDGEGAEKLNIQIAEKEAELAASQAQMDALDKQDKKRREVVETIQEQIDAYEGLSDAAQVSMLSGDEEEKAGYLRDANDQIGELTESYKELTKAEEEESEAKDDNGKKTKNLTDFTGAYNTIIRMLPAPLRSLVGGMRSLSKASLKFLATPLGATLLALSATFKGVSFWLNNTNSGILAKAKWTQKISDLTEKWSDKLGIVSKKMKEVGDATASGAAEQITAYRNLQRQWEQANGVLEKQKEVLASDEWGKLGLSISGVNDAENILVSNSENVINALMARARAAAIYKQLQDEIEEQIKLEDNVEKDTQTNKADKEFREQRSKELEEQARRFREATKEQLPGTNYYREGSTGKEYVLDKEGNKIYRGERNDQAWERVVKESYADLRGVTGQGYFVGRDKALIGNDAYEKAAERLSQNAKHFSILASDAQHIIDSKEQVIEEGRTRIKEKIDRINGLYEYASSQIEDAGIEENATRQQQLSSDEQDRKRKREKERNAEDIEIATTQATITAMKDGTEKTIAQINLDNKKEKLALKRAYEDLREEKIEQARKLFESDPKNKHLTFTYDYNSSEYAPTVAEAKKYLAEKNAVEAESAKKTRDAMFQEQEAMYSYLKEYGNYWEKRLATINHYNGLIERATTVGERKRLTEEKEETLNALERERVAFRAQSGIVEEQIAAIDAETKAGQTRLIKDMDNIVGVIKSSTQGLVDAKANLGQMMNDMFNGNVDLTNRPQIPSIALVDAGWDVDLTNLEDKISRISDSIRSIPGIEVISDEDTSRAVELYGRILDLRGRKIGLTVDVDKDKIEAEISAIERKMASLSHAEDTEELSRLYERLELLKGQLSGLQMKVDTENARRELDGLMAEIRAIPGLELISDAQIEQLSVVCSDLERLNQLFDIKVRLSGKSDDIENKLADIKEKFSSIPVGFAVADSIATKILADTDGARAEVASLKQDVPVLDILSTDNAAQLKTLATRLSELKLGLDTEEARNEIENISNQIAAIPGVEVLSDSDIEKIARIAKLEENSTGVTIDTANAEGAISAIKEELSKTENFEPLSSEEIDKITELILALARLKDQEVSLSVNTNEADKEIASLRNRVISIPVIGELDEAELSRLASLVRSVSMLQEMSIETDTTQIDNTIDEIKDKFSSIPGINALSDEALATLVQYLALLGTIKNEQAAISNDSIATVYSMDYEVEDASGETHSILVTPILQDGTVLTPDTLSEYIDNTINGAENLLSADNLGIIIGVDVNPGDGEFLHKMQELFYSSEPIEYDLDTNFIGRVEWALPDIDPNALARPYLDAQKLIENGWKDENDNLVFSNSVEVTDKDNKTHKIVVTPVLSNGDVLTKEELDNYISNVISGAEDIKAADSIGIVIGVDVNDDELNILQKLQTVYYSDNGNDNEKLAVLKEEILLLAERYRLTVLQNDLKKAETEKQFAENGTRAEQIAAMRKLLDAQAALIKDTKHREIFKASGDVKIAQETYGNWRDYQTEDESIKAANAVYEAKKKEFELRQDNVSLMRLEIEHSQEMFDIQMKYNKDIKSIFGNVSRYTKEQLENARNLASSILKSGKYTDNKGNTTALTQTNIKELQEAINQIDDAQFNKKFEGGSNDVLDLIKNASYLGDLRRRLAEETGKGDKADANVIKDLEDRIEQEKEAIKKGLVSTGAAFFADSLQRSVEYMRQIAELSGDVQLSETAEGLGSFAQTLGAAAQGFASGGWIGAIVGGVQDMATQLVQSFAQATAETHKQKKNAEDFAKEMKMAALSIETEDFNSIFGSDKSGLMSEYGKKRVESLRAYNEELDKLNSQDYAPDQKQQWWEGMGMAIFGGPLFSLIDPVAGVAAPYIIGAQEKDTQAFEAYQDALSRGLTGLQTMMIKTKDQSGFANFFGVQDEYTALGDLAPELWGDDGVFSVKNAEKFLKTNQQINEEQREQIENMIELQGKVDEAKQGMKDALASVFSNTASALADATIEGLHNGATMGAADMKRILSGTAKELQKSMVESIYARYMQKYQDEAFKILEKDGGEEDLMRLYSDMLTQMEQTIPIAQNAARRMEEMGEAMGFDMSGLQNATPSQASYQTISETTGTAIDGRLTSLQISSGEQTGLLGMMNMSMSQMLEQVNNGTRIADDVRNILTDSYLELVEIRKNTGDNVSELKLVKQMVATIEEHTRRL